MVAALALLILLAPQDDETVTYGNVLFRRPAGWKAEAKEESLLLKPGEDPFLVMIFPGANAEGTLAEAFEKAWKQAAGTSKITSTAPGRELKTEAGTDGLMSVGLLETTEGVRLLATVAVFKPGDRSQMVLAFCPRDDVFQRYTEDLGAFLKSLRFRNLELPAYELFVTSEPKPKFHVLFKDGTSIGALPPEGLDGLTARAAAAKFPGSTIKLQPSGEGTFAAQDGTAWTRAAASTGLRLQGRYLRHGDEDKPETPCFGFKADGTFEDLGAGKAAAPGDGSGSATGTGGYELFNNTLYLTYRDNRRRKASWVAQPRAANEKAPEWILVGGIRFDRR